MKQFLNKYGFDSSSNIHLDGIFEKRFECPSCLDEFTVEEMTAMSCGHFFCNPCFSNYLTVQIAEGKFFFKKKILSNNQIFF